MKRRRLRSFHVETWGCQMNRHDSELISGQLTRAGLRLVDSAESADLVLLNTCSVREKPVQKIRSRIGHLERQAHRPAIAVCGCVAQQEAASLLQQSTAVRLVIGPGQLAHLAAAVRQVEAGQRPVLTGFTGNQEGRGHSVARSSSASNGSASSTRAMVTVIEGCESHCTFCVVPFTRGPEVSRPLDEVLQEVRQAAAAGRREVELLGQTINAYRCPDSGADLADLLTAVAAVPGLSRVRYLTSHPRYFTDRLIKVLASHPTVSRYLHLPFQSGSDAVLRRMHRRYTRAEYLDLLTRIRSAVPSISLSTDVIVGFPGETEADFQLTLDLLDQARFSHVFAFTYSPRPQTPASRLVDDVPEQEKKQRIHRLFQLTESIARELNQQLIGHQVEVLIDGPSRRSAKDWQGRGEDNRVVNFAKTGYEQIGDLVHVRIIRASAHSLVGERADSKHHLPILQPGNLP